jgi:hypothetical protein
MKNATAGILCLIVVVSMLGILSPAQHQNPSTPVSAAPQLQGSAPAGPSYVALPPALQCANPTDEKLFNESAKVSFNPYSGLKYITGPVIPSSNVVSQYAKAIYVTVSPLNSANLSEVILSAWGTGWSNQTLPSTSPTAIAQWDLPIKKGVATGILNDQKYFPPGATVYFNLTVVSSVSNDVPVYSPCAAKVPTWGNGTFASWGYLVSGGWPSPVFSKSIGLTAFPNILNGVYPGVYQPVQLTLNSLTSTPIGGANITYNITTTNILSGSTTVYSCGVYSCGDDFSPANSTTAMVNISNIAYSRNNYTTVTFRISAWALWSGGAVNFIQSDNFTYPITAGGTWCGSNQTWSQDVTLSTAPYANISGGVDVPIVAMSDVVNVSIVGTHSNVTIDYAFVIFNETYQGKSLPGKILMIRENSTAEFTGDSLFGAQTGNAVMGPYLPGMNVTFYVAATDTLGCTIQSPNYRFHTVSGPPTVLNGKTYFYVVALDEGHGTYAVGAQVTFSHNGTVISSTQTNQLGFAYPNYTSSSLPMYLPMNETYNVTVVYDGSSQSTSYLLTPTSNKTLTFLFNAGASAPVVYAESAAYVLPTIVGLIAVTAILVPVYFFWMELQRRAKEEEKRVTL